MLNNDYPMDRIRVETYDLAPYKYNGRLMCGVMEIYYLPKHANERIKLRSLPIPCTNKESVKEYLRDWQEENMFIHEKIENEEDEEYYSEYLDEMGWKLDD